MLSEPSESDYIIYFILFSSPILVIYSERDSGTDPAVDVTEASAISVLWATIEIRF